MPDRRNLRFDAPIVVNAAHMTYAITQERPPVAVIDLQPVNTNPMVPVSSPPDPKVFQRAMKVTAALATTSQVLATTKGPAAASTGLSQWLSDHWVARDGSIIVTTLSAITTGFIACGTLIDGHVKTAAVFGGLTAAFAGWAAFAWTAQDRAAKNAEAKKARRITTRDIAPLIRQVDALPAPARPAVKPALECAVGVMGSGLSAKAHDELSAFISTLDNQQGTSAVRAVQLGTLLQRMVACPGIASTILPDCRELVAQANQSERQALAEFTEHTLFTKKEQPVAAFDDERALYAFIRELKGPPAGPNQ